MSKQRMEWICTVPMATLWSRAAAPFMSARCLLLKEWHRQRNSNSSNMLKLQHCRDWVDQSCLFSSNFWPLATRDNCSNNTNISNIYINSSPWQLSKETKLSSNSRLNSILDHHRLSSNMAHLLLQVVVWASHSSNDLQNQSQSTILMSLPRQVNRNPTNTSLNSNATLVISSEKSRRTKIPTRSNSVGISWATMLVVKIFTCNIRTIFKPVTRVTRQVQDSSSIRPNKLYRETCKKWIPIMMSNSIWVYVFKRDKAHSKISNSQCNRSSSLKANRQADQSN